MTHDVLEGAIHQRLSLNREILATLSGYEAYLTGLSFHGSHYETRSILVKVAEMKHLAKCLDQQLSMFIQSSTPSMLKFVDAPIMFLNIDVNSDMSKIRERLTDIDALYVNMLNCVKIWFSILSNLRMEMASFIKFNKYLAGAPSNPSGRVNDDPRPNTSQTLLGVHGINEGQLKQYLLRDSVEDAPYLGLLHQ
jgi:hypothetical protein